MRTPLANAKDTRSILDLAAEHRDQCSLAATARPRPGESITAWRKRIKCIASSVNPKDIPAAIAAAKKRGVNIDFTPEGHPIYESRGHRKEYLEKVRGMFDMDGGYGDAAPTGVDFNFNENPR